MNTESKDLTASGVDVSKNLQHLMGIAKELSACGKEEELLRDLFHHKQTKVQQNHRKRMKDLRCIIENSRYRNILESKEMDSVGAVVAYAFLSYEFRDFLKQLSTAANMILKKKEISSTPMEDISLYLLGISQTVAAHKEYAVAIEVLIKHSNQIEEYRKQRGEAVSMDSLPKEYHPAPFVEMWVGGEYSLDKLFGQLIEFEKISNGDPQVRNLIAQWRTWFVQAKNISMEDVTDQVTFAASESLVLKTRLVLLSPEYKTVVQSIRRELLHICQYIQREVNMNEMRETFSKIAQRVILDANGQPTFKEELFKQAHVIARSILQSIQYIPLPTIHKKTETSELILEDVEIRTHDILPSSLEIYHESKESQCEDEAILIIKITNIKAYLSNVRFTFRKDAKLIQKSVCGKADIDIGGDEGMELTVRLVPNVIAFSDKVVSLFEVEQAVCSIAKLKIHLRETSHDKFYKLLSPVLNKVASRKLEQSISQFVALYVSKLNNVSAEQINEAIQQGKLHVDQNKFAVHSTISANK